MRLASGKCMRCTVVCGLVLNVYNSHSDQLANDGCKQGDDDLEWSLAFNVGRPRCGLRRQLRQSRRILAPDPNLAMRGLHPQVARSVPCLGRHRTQDLPPTSPAHLFRTHTMATVRDQDLKRSIHRVPPKPSSVTNRLHRSGFCSLGTCPTTTGFTEQIVSWS